MPTTATATAIRRRSGAEPGRGWGRWHRRLPRDTAAPSSSGLRCGGWRDARYCRAKRRSSGSAGAAAGSGRLPEPQLRAPIAAGAGGNDGGNNGLVEATGGAALDGGGAGGDPAVSRGDHGGGLGGARRGDGGGRRAARGLGACGGGGERAADHALP